jgi:hypothetical protein
VYQRQETENETEEKNQSRGGPPHIGTSPKLPQRTREGFVYLNTASNDRRLPMDEGCRKPSNKEMRELNMTTTDTWQNRHERQTDIKKEKKKEKEHKQTARRRPQS